VKTKTIEKLRTFDQISAAMVIILPYFIYTTNQPNKISNFSKLYKNTEITAFLWENQSSM